jgi:hypothetical protein
MAKAQSTQYNNHVTYDEKWNTPENKAAMKKLYPYLRRTRCGSDCPDSWAVEVLELVKKVEKLYGIRYHASTRWGYSSEGDIKHLTWLVKDLLGKPYIHTYGEMKKPTTMDYIKKWFTGLPERLSSFSSRINDYVRYVLWGRFYNWYRKPQVSLDQIKEKFGTLRFYFSAPYWIDKHVDEMIMETEIKLSEKGAYYSLLSLYGTTHSRIDDTLDFELSSDKKTKTVVEYPVKRLMKKLGYNIEEFEKQRQIKLKEKERAKNKRNSH